MTRPAPTWRDPRFPRQLMWTLCTPVGVVYAVVWVVVYLIQKRLVRALAILVFGCVSGGVWFSSMEKMAPGAALLGGLFWCGVVLGIDEFVWRRPKRATEAAEELTWRRPSRAAEAAEPVGRPAPEPSFVTPEPKNGARGRYPRPY